MFVTQLKAGFIGTLKRLWGSSTRLRWAWPLTWTSSPRTEAASIFRGLQLLALAPVLPWRPAAASGLTLKMQIGSCKWWQPAKAVLVERGASWELEDAALWLAAPAGCEALGFFLFQLSLPPRIKKNNHFSVFISFYKSFIVFIFLSFNIGEDFPKKIMQKRKQKQVISK